GKIGKSSITILGIDKRFLLTQTFMIAGTIPAETLYDSARSAGARCLGSVIGFVVSFVYLRQVNCPEATFHGLKLFACDVFKRRLLVIPRVVRQYAQPIVGSFVLPHPFAYPLPIFFLDRYGCRHIVCVTASAEAVAHPFSIESFDTVQEIQHIFIAKYASSGSFLRYSYDGLLAVKQIVFQQFGMVDVQVSVEGFVFSYSDSSEIVIVVPRMYSRRGAQHQRRGAGGFYGCA